MTNRIVVGVTLRADGKGLVGEVRLAQRELDKLGATTRKTGTAARGAGRDMDAFAKDKRRAASESQRLNRELKGVHGSLGALKSILPTIGLGLLIKDTIRAGQEMEKFRALLNPEQFAFVDQQAERLGRNLRNLGNDYAKLSAAAAGTNLEGQQTDEIFLAINEAMTALRRSGPEVSGALRAIEQMISKGNVQAEELRGQLGERLPGAFHAAATAMGVTTSQLNKMLERGEVLAEDLLPKLAKVLREKYADELEAAMSSSVAEMERLQTTIFKIQSTIAEAGFLDGVTESIRDLNELLKSPGAEAAAVELGQALGVIARNLDLITIALAGGGLFKIGSLLVGGAVRARQVAGAFGLVRGALALLGGPVGAATVAAGAIYALYRAYEDAEKPTDRLVELHNDLNEAMNRTPLAASQAAREVQKATFDELVTAEKRLAEERAKLDRFEGLVSKEAADHQKAVIQGWIDKVKELQQAVISAKNDAKLFEEAARLGISINGERPGLRRDIAATGRELRAADEAKRKVDAFVESLREEARVASLAARELAGHNAVQEAIRDNMVASNDISGQERIRAEAIAMYDRAKATKDAAEERERLLELDRLGAQAVLESRAAAEQALAAENEAYEKLMEQKREEERKARDDRVEELQESLKTELELEKERYEDALEVAQMVEDGKVDATLSAAEMRTRIEAQHAERVTAIYEAEMRERHKLLFGFIDEASAGFARYFVDLTIGERQAKDAAKSQLNERLRDLDESLREGTISVEDANEKRKELYEDFYDRLNEIEKEAADRLKDTLVSAFVSAIEEMLSEWIKRGMTRLVANILPGVDAQSLAGGTVSQVLGSGNPLGSVGLLGKLGKEIGASIGNGTGIAKSIVTGLKNAFTGVDAFAAGNLGFKGPAAFATQAQAASAPAATSAFGSNIGWSGVAVPLAIGAYGFGVQSRKQAERRERQQEFFREVGTGTSEQLGEGGWDFRGLLDDANAFFSTTREGWRSTIEALEEAGVLTRGWGAMLDENGKGLVKIQGDIDGVKSALSNAAATGYDFVGSLTNAIEKGNDLRVNIQGDAEAIATALDAATAIGIGGFHSLQNTGSGVTAVLTGNIDRWDEYLQGFVNSSVREAVSGVNAIGSAFASVTRHASQAAKAASQVRVGSTVRGGRSAQVNGSHRFGIDFVPHDDYLGNLHWGERVLSAPQNAMFTALMRSLASSSSETGPGSNNRASGREDPDLVASMGGDDVKVILMQTRDNSARTARAFEELVRQHRASGGR